MSAGFVVKSASTWVYTDEAGQVVHGYRVFVSFPEFDEVHEVLVPSMDPAKLKIKAESLLKQRQDLAKL